MLNELKRYYQENMEEIAKVLVAVNYSINPWSVYRLYHTGD